MGIEVKNIQKKFKDFKALDNVNLKVASGELVALLGPSGSGKTTLLRIIAGLELPDEGSVMLDGELAHQKDVRQRQVGFVFQHYALFKHMTVFENVAFGMRVRPKRTRPSDANIREKVMELLSLVHLEQFGNRYPSQLSGGQRQRVALARALAVEPKVLLLDEPFGALDAKVRKELRRWMRRLHDEMHITSIFVTHDQEEAMEVSDRVVVMSNGRIEQVGTPEEVYHKPANGFVYDFLGNYNSFDGWKDKGGNLHLAEYDVQENTVPASTPVTSRIELRSLLGKLVPSLKPVVQPEPEKKIKRHRLKLGEGSPVKLFARPHEMYIAKKAEDDFEYIETKVVHVNPAGPLVKLELERQNGEIIQTEIPKDVCDKLAVKKGDVLLARPKKLRTFE
ncbi:MAG: sulfate ABC transporter ATP-binding protein [Proteobacteria bacterium]|nr:sulfate ABC transporter ATP-binding protein [Pseudomonadota bacterium]